MYNTDDIYAALKGVEGPDRVKSLVESGAVSGVNIRDGKVFVTIAVDPDRAAASEPMRLAAEAAIKAIPGVAVAMVALTSERGPEARGNGSGHGAQRPMPNAEPERGVGLENISKIVAVASGKGGVGKSTTAANLAIALARLGLRTGLLDADIFGPSLPRLFGIKEKPELSDDGRSLAPLEKFGVKLMSIGFLVEDDAAIVWRGPMVMSAITQLLREVAWGQLDVLVVDMPPGTGDVQLTMAQNASLAGAIIVSTPQDLALIDARRGIAMFQQVRVPILGLFENMSYFLCPHCGGRSDIFAHGGARAEADKFKVPFLGEAPLDIAIREGSDHGLPVMASAPESNQAKPYLALAEYVRDALAQGSREAGRKPKIVIG